MNAETLASKVWSFCHTLFWLKDASLGGLDNLPEPHVLVGEIIAHLESGLEAFRSVTEELESSPTT
ncbi:hypothetical protein [Halomonas sp. BM-2019]|uniref:hypothetical protein n=1 Tax=Halomonas sp. BM-2019 TaxID=2811227 RepID=UPI001B3C1E14|nr:MAG: hypothetical protein J5F18_00635 [Halomonas sp. BM-2019]